MRGLFDTATTLASELANEWIAFQILFVFIFNSFNNSRQSKLHYRNVKCEITVRRFRHGKKVSFVWGPIYGPHMGSYSWLLYKNL